MTETNQLPESFDIEIDHKSLAGYYRKQWGGIDFALCCGPCGFLGMAVGTGGKNRHFESAADALLSSAIGFFVGILIGAIFATVIYYLFIRRNAIAEAESLQVRVEGPFLRIMRGTSRHQDRKLHFKAIVDYTYFQDSMMRSCGVEGIKLTTTAGGHDSSKSITGIKNAMKVRDMLCEIDRLREDA